MSSEAATNRPGHRLRSQPRFLETPDDVEREAAEPPSVSLSTGYTARLGRWTAITKAECFDGWLHRKALLIGKPHFKHTGANSAWGRLFGGVQ